MKYIDQLDAVGRAAMEIGVEAGMQKVSDMFLAALAQEGFGEERLYRLACRVSELDAEFDGAYAAVRRQTGCKNGWTRSCARPAARTLSRSASATRISENSITRRYHPGARKNDLDLWRGLLP